MTSTYAPPVRRDPDFFNNPWKGPGPIPNQNGVHTLADLLAHPHPEWFIGVHRPFDDFGVSAVVGHEAATGGPRPWLPGLFNLQDTLSGEINAMTAGLSGYGSYIDGYGGYGELVARFDYAGGPFLYSITVDNTPGAREADVEPGAMQNGDLPGWYPTAITDEISYPMVYTSAGNAQAVIDTMGSLNFIRDWAHYGFGPHVCGPAVCGYPQAHMTQFSPTGPVGQNVDQTLSLWIPNLNPTPPPPPPPKPGDDDVATLITLENKDGRVEVWSIGNNGVASHKYMQTDGKWSGWIGFTASAKFVTLSVPAAQHPDGHCEVFAHDANGTTYHNWQNGANGTWQKGFVKF